MADSAVRWGRPNRSNRAERFKENMDRNSQGRIEGFGLPSRTLARRSEGRGGKGRTVKVLVVFSLVLLEMAAASPHPSSSQNRMFECTFQSRKAYTDPFNDVDIDVVFSKDGRVWRVPTFWRGGSKWTVRFAPSTPGEYTYHLESTDRNNPDLNGHDGRVTITAYNGTSTLLRHGMLRVSANKRYFEHADGTPFYWLGDTWWTGLSGRLSWEGFQELTVDRKAKGFTVVQIVAGLLPTEQQAPSDPGSCNEGGCVWDTEFKRINPIFFDYADKRVQHLIDSGIAPALVGAWSEKLDQMGVAKLKKHWRYIIARYGAYPVFWIVGGEVFDPTEEARRRLPSFFVQKVPGGWTEVARYIHATDPYEHPVTVHEVSPDDLPLQDESVTDFHLFQPAHFGWPSIAVEVAQLDTHYARSAVTKPLVVGEIGYETLGGQHLEDFQRVAFWLAMLNGAAGHTYGANGVWEAYTPHKPVHWATWALLTWKEGMNLPGSYQIGLGAKLLRQYPWWQFEPHPEWVMPRGTTLLEPRSGANVFHIDLAAEWGEWPGSSQFFDPDHPVDEWKAREGNFRLPYAAGIPGEVRFIYMPYSGIFPPAPPTVLGLEPGVRYGAYFWDPALGIKIDLGTVERPSPAAVIREDKFEAGKASAWTDYGTKSVRDSGTRSANGDMLAVLNEISETNLVAAVDAHSDSEAGLVLRFHDADNYLAAIYSSKEKAIYLLDRKVGVDGPPLCSTPAPTIGPNIRLTAEVRGGWAAVSVTDAQHRYTSGIVRVMNTMAGSAGLRHRNDGSAQSFGNFELRKSPVLATNEHLGGKLYDARGGYRGELSGLKLPEMGEPETSSWHDFGKNKLILLDAYRPERSPYGRDWILVLEKRK
jgi:hypothetical protein